MEKNVIGNFKVENPIGRGSFGVVHLGHHKDTGEPVAIKIIPKISTNSYFCTEFEILNQLDHPFILPVYSFFQDDSNFYLVTEYCPNGDLSTFLAKRKKLSESEARRIFVELISALDYLHNEVHVVHHDIKLENILLDQFNHIRISDFGFASFTSERPQTESISNEIYGSPHYFSPETFFGRESPEAAEIWAAGVVLYALVVGRLPFEGKDILELKQSISLQTFDVPETMSPDLKELLMQLLNKDFHFRIQIPAIILHPWFSSVIYSSIKKAMKKSSKDLSYMSELLLKPQYRSFTKLMLTEIDLSNPDTLELYKMIKRIEIMHKIHDLMNLTDKKEINCHFNITVRPVIGSACPLNSFSNKRFPAIKKVAHIRSLELLDFRPDPNFQ